MASLIPIPMNRIRRLEYLVSQLTSKLVTIQSIAAGSGNGSGQPIDTTHISRLSVNTLDDINIVNIVNVDDSVKALKIHSANGYKPICTLDDSGDMVLAGTITGSECLCHCRKCTINKCCYNIRITGR